MVGYVDSYYASHLDKRRSLSGYVFTGGGCTVCWKTCLHATVVICTTEVRYMAITDAIKEAL